MFMDVNKEAKVLQNEFMTNWRIGSRKLETKIFDEPVTLVHRVNDSRDDVVAQVYSSVQYDHWAVQLMENDRDLRLPSVKNGIPVIVIKSPEEFFKRKDNVSARRIVFEAIVILFICDRLELKNITYKEALAAAAENLEDGEDQIESYFGWIVEQQYRGNKNIPGSLMSNYGRLAAESFVRSNRKFMNSCFHIKGSIHEYLKAIYIEKAANTLNIPISKFVDIYEHLTMDEIDESVLASAKAGIEGKSEIACMYTYLNGICRKIKKIYYESKKPKDQPDHPIVVAEEDEKKAE